MTRALVLGLTGLVGGLIGVGCSAFCADCNCGDGPYSAGGTIKTADRAELEGGTVNGSYGSVTIAYTRADGTEWQVYYNASEAP